MTNVFKKGRVLPYNIQFFAEGGTEGSAASGAASGEGLNVSTGASGTFTYQQLDEIATTRASRAEKSALKNFFKQQGLTEEEADEAFTDYKTKKKEQSEQGVKDIETYKKAAQDAQEETNRLLMEMEVSKAASALSIPSDKLDYVLKLADISDVKDENGKFKKDAVKNALNKVLTDLPGLVGESSKGGFHMGSQQQQKKNNDETDRIRKMFGLSTKK